MSSDVTSLSNLFKGELAMQQAVGGRDLKASLQMHWWSCLTQGLFSSD